MGALVEERLKQKPKLLKEVDVPALNLDEEVLSILAHIDGENDCEKLAVLMKLSQEELRTKLALLEQNGVIGFEDVAPVAKSDAKCDLTPDEQNMIIAQEKVIAEGNYFEILDLAPSVRGADLRKAFLAGSKRFHPDMYFGRKLGDFRKRMEIIFRAMKEAHDFLAEDDQRKVYAKKIIEESGLDQVVMDEVEDEDDAESEIEMDPERRARLELIEAQRKKKDERQERLEERRRLIKDKRRSRVPAEGNLKKAKDLHEMGMEQLRAGDLYSAAASFKLASTFAPHNGEYRHQFKETQDKAVEQKAIGIAETADLDSSAGNPGQAAREYAQASDLVQNTERFAVRAAEEYFKTDDYDAAWFYANRAVKAAPRSKKSRLVAASVLEARQDYAGALVHAEMAQSIDKEDANIKKMIKRLAKEIR
ncbi:MAG: hypothetical protein QGI45_10980 [Myxococcota bacterium]|jgi:tetratricopeptide (TPR) repeat protein|nr:hypothetical protein [Myxococcota bacterium]